MSTNLRIRILPFLTGKPFSTTKDTKVTKVNMPEAEPIFPFVYLVPFVVRLFPVNYGRARIRSFT